MSFLSILRQSLIPPADLYKPLARLSLNLGEKGTKSGVVEFKHSGTYEVTVDLTRDCLPYRVVEFATQVRFTLQIGQTILIEETSELPRSRYRVCQFEIPDHAPQHQVVEFTLTVVEGNAEFERVCGPVHFQIRHGSVK